MRKWSRWWATLAGSLLGLAQLPGPAAAQFPPGDPQPLQEYGPPTPPSIPTQGGGPAMPPQGTPFSLRNDGSPNAFDDDDGCRPPQQPYILSIRGEYLQWWVSRGHL